MLRFFRVNNLLNTKVERMKLPARAEICDFDDLVVNNNDVMLKNIAEDLRNHLPVEAVFNWEHLALQKVVHADICTQASLQKAVVVVMNNVFEYFLDRQEQARTEDSALDSVPQLTTSSSSSTSIVSSYDMETTGCLNYYRYRAQPVGRRDASYDVFMEKEVDREALEQINSYKIL